jgi:hypothetical protein
MTGLDITGLLNADDDEKATQALLEIDVDSLLTEHDRRSVKRMLELERPLTVHEAQNIYAIHGRQLARKDKK